jgi:hypothetical protein
MSVDMGDSRACGAGEPREFSVRVAVPVQPPLLCCRTGNSPQEFAMNRIAIAVALGLAASLAVAAEKKTETPPPAAADLKVAPPPGLDDPGVKAAVDAETAAQADADKGKSASRAPKGNTTVTVRNEGDDTIEEYRTDGKVSMIRISRKGGVPHEYLDTDGDGKLEGNPKEGPVAPVYFKLYEWN